ncbi:MAG TPA: glycosyltransferase [Bacteroidia bacterium]|nr:glycosyltransferase [Bacteroidia bacterium]
MPLVSVIIPAYNAEKFIAETIQSVLIQTYTRWEIIVVNDGSTDNSASIVTSFIEKDNRITLINKPNSGVSDTRNVGIEKSKGEFIAFLDADDIWESNNLEEKVSVLSTTTIDWVFSDAYLIDENTDIIGEKKGDDSEMLIHYLLWDRTVIPGPCSNVIVKRKCLNSGLRFDAKFSTAADQDFCFYLSSKFLGKRIEKYLWKYRILKQSMSRNIAVMEKDHIGVYKKAAKNKLFSSVKFQQKCFSNLYLILAGSWWKDGKNKTRGAYFIFRSVLAYPPNVLKLLKKI